jgi:fructose-1,6-bisphosphatase I
MTKKLITIERHMQDQQKLYPQATGTFTRMLQDMALAGKIISRAISRGGLAEFMGEAGTVNSYGERQQKLDIFADEVIFKMNDHTGRVCAMASEEHDDLIEVPVEYDTGNYVLLYDPLDGSSNIDVNVSVGTIFSIHRKYSRGERGTMEDVLQEGKRQLAAGYIIYGSSTMMVYTVGRGVHGFTLDTELGEFILTHENMRYPEKPTYYSVNHGNEKHWTSGVRRYVKWLQGMDGEGHKPLSNRYIGSLVSDFHRNLLRGGVFTYPADYLDKDKPFGKMRLMFEAQAFAFIAEQAGGYASDGIGDILNIRPHSLHQRVPMFVGNRPLVEKAEEYIRTNDQEWMKHYREYRQREMDFAQAK